MPLNDPETFILESTPLAALNRKPVKLKPGQIRRIPRTHERPAYTILKPHEIRERMKLPMPVGSPWRPPVQRARLAALVQRASNPRCRYTDLAKIDAGGRGGPGYDHLSPLRERPIVKILTIGRPPAIRPPSITAGGRPLPPGP